MYEFVKEELLNMADESYKTFHGSLIPGVQTEFLGVRVPKLRILAKKIIKDDWRSFLSEWENSNVYEIIMLYGMVMAGAKCDFEEKLKYVEKFVPQIDNWAVCDIVSGDLKEIKKHRERMYEFIHPYLHSEKEYELRFAIVVLMQYYLTEEYIDQVLYWYGNIHHEGYYVKMAIAWGISVCFVKYRDKTIDFLQHCEMDTFTYNKALQKMRESYRVSAEDKELLRTMKKHTE
ncbi:MAG: DNA alkylation repair protein [Lachnospiraceae bacterium]|nr:DNA alkylation repair protein [Lachnospiraceae bacterium]